MSVFKLKYNNNVFSKEMKDDPVVQESIWKTAFGMGKVYLYRLDSSSWEYFLKSVVKPALQSPYKEYLKVHRAKLFLAESE